MAAKKTSAVYSIVAYLAAIAALLLLMAFLAGALSHSVDGPASASPGVALAVDLGWFILFAAQHSIMARPAFKAKWTRIIPAGAERSTYVLASALMLALLVVVWQPIPRVVWRVSGAASYVLMAVSLMGWLLALAATFAIDHFELFGLRGIFGARREAGPHEAILRTPLLYRFVRHPLYLGFLIAFWAAPLMTVGHAIFAAGMTIYIAIGVHYEERDLVRTFGETYVRYREKVPAVLPWPRP